MKPHANNHHASGFSLAEVVLSLGIISFAIVPLVALVPIGLNSAREAADQTVQASIVQAVSARAQQTPYAQLGKWDQAELYFDAEGLPAKKEDALYKAEVKVSGTLDLVSGQAGAARAKNASASTVTVEIKPANRPAVATPIPKFPVHVARVDQN